jgi:hypothetical protein
MGSSKRFGRRPLSVRFFRAGSPWQEAYAKTAPIPEYWRTLIANMCRNIRTLFNFEPPVTEEEILAASLQFVRKISGFNKPSRANEAAFFSAVDDIARISGRLLESLESTASPKNRQEEAARAKVRAAQRFGK